MLYQILYQAFNQQQSSLITRIRLRKSLQPKLYICYYKSILLVCWIQWCNDNSLREAPSLFFKIQ